MTLFYRWIAILTLAGAAAAQDKGTPPAGPLPREQIRVIELMQADVQEVAASVNRVAGGLAIVSADPTRRALIVRGTPEAVSIVEELAKRLDQPASPRVQTNVELTVHLLYASTAEAKGESLPADLAGTVKQLSALFPYKSYRVLESFLLRGRDGQQTDTAGSLPNSRSSYSFRYRPSLVPGTAPRVIRLDDVNLLLHLRNDIDNTFVEASIRTGLDAREGQKIVVGKSNVAGTADAMILVVSPKIVE